MINSRINIENYIFYFIDKMDGALSANQLEELNNFLLQYPHLKEELDELQNSKLEPSDNITFIQKQLLIKQEEVSIEMNELEELSIAEMEEDITLEQKERLKVLVLKSKENQDEYDIIHELKLKPSPKERFKGKIELKRTPAFNLTYKQVRTLSSIAATFALLLSLGYFYFKTITNNNIIENFAIEVNTVDSSLYKAEPDSKSNIPIIVKNDGIDNIRNEKAIEKSYENNGDQKEVENYIANYISFETIKPIGVQKIVSAVISEPKLTFADLVLISNPNEIPIVNLAENSKKEIGLFELAEMGINRLSNFTESTISLNGQRDSDGNLTRITFEAGLFAISRPVKNKK